MLNIRFIIKMLGMMFILETLFMLAATAVAFLYKGSDFYPLLQSSGIMFGTGVLFTLIGLRANEHTAGRREGMLTVYPHVDHMDGFFLARLVKKKEPIQK